MPSLLESDIPSIRTYMQRLFAVTDHIRLSEMAFFQILIIKLPPSLTQTALRFRHNGSLQDLIDHLMMLDQSFRTTREIKFDLENLSRDNKTLPQLLATAQNLEQELRGRVPDDFHHWFTKHALRNLLYRLVNANTLLHLQDIKTRFPDTTVVQLFKQARRYEQRLAIAQSLSSSRSFNQHLQATPADESLSPVPLDTSNSEDPEPFAEIDIDTKINAIISSKRANFKRTTPSRLSLPNAVFYEHMLHALIDSKKNDLCRRDPYTSISHNYTVSFPKESKQLTRAKVEHYWVPPSGQWPNMNWTVN